MSPVRRIVTLLFAPLFLFVFNLAICGRLLRIDYLDQMQSIEGSFIAMAVYIQHHWPGYDWFPLWRTGMPSPRVYQPALHYTVAALASASGFSAARSYHILIAITYSLGAVAFYVLARVLGSSRLAAFASSLVFSVFSPAAFLATQVFTDNRGRLYGRRLQALVVYGEGPNITGLMLALLALAALHLALQKRAQRKRTALSGLVAAIAIATVPATSWPATMALAMAILAYFLAWDFAGMKTSLPRLVAIGLGAWALASPFALLSNIRITLSGLAAIQDPPTGGLSRWIGLALVFAAMTVVRALLIRAPFGLRFAALWLVLTAGIVLPNYYLNLRLLSNPARFHLAMEIAIVLTGCLAAAFVPLPGPRKLNCFAAALVIFACVFFGFRCRSYARSMIRPIDITKTLEFEEARWADANLHGARFMAPGTVALWMNIFTETPQAGGGFDMSLWNSQNLVESYLVWNGMGDDANSADLALLWLKAYAVAAVGTGNEHTREFYHAWQHPDRFVGRLTRAWPESGTDNARANDEIYLVPERSPSLARVVPSRVLMQHPPAHGVEMSEMRPFVNAIDDPSLPLASFTWQDANHAKLDGALTRGEAIEVAINYDRGWSATANGRPTDVRADGLGFIEMQPECEGACDVELKWSSGAEPIISWCAAIGALVVALGLVWRERA